MPGYLIGGRLVAGGGREAGEITIRAVPAVGGSFELPLNGDGSLDTPVFLPMIDPVTGARVDLPNLLVPGRDFIGWVERTIPGNPDGDVIIEAGPLWADPFTEPNVARLIANGLWSYFDHRVIMPVLAGRLPRDVTSTWSGLSLRTISKRIVQQAISHEGAGLPIDFEDDIPGTNQREYRGSDRKRVGEALRELTEVEGGPDITFRPHFTEDRRGVRWAMLTGDPVLSQSGEDHYWDVSVPTPYVRIVDFERDGTELTSREYGVGKRFRNLIQNSSNEEDGGSYRGQNVSLDLNDTTWAAHGSRSINLYGASAADSCLTIGGDVGGMRNSMEPGKTYTFSATGCVKEAVGASMPTETDGSNGTQMSRTRALVVHALTPSGYRIYHSEPVPNVVGAARRVHVTFTLPPDTTAAFLRAYLGSTSGQIRWDAFSLTDSPEPVDYDPIETTVETVTDSPDLLDAGFPLLESVTDRSSVERLTTLKAYGAEAVGRGAAHVQTITLVAKRDRVPNLGTYWPGDYVTLNVGEHKRLTPGRHRVRIVGMQFEKAGDVTIQCAPERVVSGYPVPSTSRTWLRDRLRALNKTVMETTRGK